MDRKEIDTQAPEAEAGITAGQAAKLLGLSHPDSVRRLFREGALRRTAAGLYTLVSVMAEKRRREAAEVEPTTAVGAGLRG